MANIKSQKKRAITNLKRQRAHAGQATAVKTAIKSVFTAVEAKDKEAAVKAFNNTSSILDKAVSSHIKSDNYAARQKSRLAKAVNSIQ